MGGVGLEMLQGRGSNAELVRERDRDCGAQQLQYGEMMDGVADAEHDFPRHVGANLSTSVFAIGNTVDDGAAFLEASRRQPAKFVPQSLGGYERSRKGGLDDGAAPALVVVDASAPDAIQQTLEVIQHMAIVSPDGCPRRALELARICFRVQRAQQGAALQQDVLDCGDQ